MVDKNTKQHPEVHVSKDYFDWKFGPFAGRVPWYWNCLSTEDGVWKRVFLSLHYKVR